MIHEKTKQNKTHFSMNVDVEYEDLIHSTGMVIFFFFAIITSFIS